MYPNLHRMPGFLFRRLHQITSSIFCDEVKNLNLDVTPVQFATLSALEHFPGIDQTALAGVVAYDRVTIGGVLQRLLEKGYIDRKINIHDRRSHELVINSLGTQVLNQISASATNIHDAVLEGLTHNEQEELLRLLNKAVSSSNSRSRSPLIPITEIRRRIKKNNTATA